MNMILQTYNFLINFHIVSDTKQLNRMDKLWVEQTAVVK